MKMLPYLLLFAFVLSCKSTTQIGTTADGPPQWLNYKGKKNSPHIVLVSGDEEYRSEEALPMLAKILNKHHGFNCTVLFAQDPARPGIINPNYLHNIPGLEQLASADLMIIFTRFRALPDEQMKHIDAYLKSGKPVLGIRTATHAFNFKGVDLKTSYAHYGNFHEEEGPWEDGFGRLVLGEKWISHHGHHKHQSTRGLPAEGKADHPIWNGIAPGDIWGPTDVYGVRLPLPGDSEPIVMGQVVNRAGDYNENDAMYGMKASDQEVAKENPVREASGNPNDPMMPIAWTKSYQLPGGQKGRVFASTIGSSTDLATEGTRRMMVNAVFWCLDREVPAKADVSIVGSYNPSPYQFTEKDHWTKVNRSVSSVR